MSPERGFVLSGVVAVRAAVAGVAVAALVAAGLVIAGGRIPLSSSLALGTGVLLAAGAASRRYGIALPGNGFSSYVLGIVVIALLAHGWPYAVIVWAKTRFWPASWMARPSKASRHRASLAM